MVEIVSKTLRNCYYRKLTYENLYNAYLRACNNKGTKANVIRFGIDLETNLASIYDCLYNNRYKPSSYREFVIYEPKERLIKSLPFRDRIIHQWYVEEFIKPYIVPRFIKDTYACIVNRGVHEAARTLQSYMRKMKCKYGDYYIIKFDISKYFYSISKDVLFEIMSKYISDKYLLNLTKSIIYDNVEYGLPIGNYTSQYFANIYLSELDYYVKFDLKIKYYCRYMDDFVILVSDKGRARGVFCLIENFVNNKLKLKLNRKSRYYPSKFGCDFCGYVIYEEYKKLRKRSIKEMKKKIKLWEDGKVGYETVLASFVSWKGHASHCDSKRIVCEFEKKLNI